VIWPLVFCWSPSLRADVVACFRHETQHRAPARCRPITSTTCGRVETCLYGLYAVPRLHFVQEPENYFALTEQLETTGRGSPARGAPLLAEVVRVTRCARRGLHCWPHFPNQVSTLDIARARGSIECGQAGGAVAPAHRDRTQPALKAHPQHGHATADGGLGDQRRADRKSARRCAFS
jgi:hypothetical protein